MWTVIYMSKNADEVTRLRNNLRDNAIISMLRKRDDFFEILVPLMEVSFAHKLIIDAEM